MQPDTNTTTQWLSIENIHGFLWNASNFLLKLIWAFVAFIVMIVIAKILWWIAKRAILKHSKWEHAEKVAKLMHDIVYYIMLWFAIFVWFEILWFDIWLLLWWVSFWIWLAFKEILWNMIAGIMILYTKEFKLWDIIEVQADQNYFWRIEEITIRYTIIRTLDLRQVIIPNLKMISVPIKTFSTERIVRLHTIIGVHYNTNIENAIQIIVNTINNLNFVIEKQNTKVYVINFGESSIDLKCVFFFDPNSWIIWEYAIWLVNEAINNAFIQNNITIPYPHRTIKFEKNIENKIKNEIKNI